MIVRSYERESRSASPVLLFPRLVRVATEVALPGVEIQWTERELERLAELASAPEANRPTENLIRAMRD